MTVYEEIGLPRVINASGRVTVLGVSTISDKVAKAAVAGGQSYVVVEDLLDKAGEIISRYTGGEYSCPTVCASAAIALSVAGMISKGKKTIMDRLPDSTGLANTEGPCHQLHRAHRNHAASGRRRAGRGRLCDGSSRRRCGRANQ